MTLRTALTTASLVLALAGCNPHRGEGMGGVPGDSDSHKPFDAISAQETLHFVGTEPFWNGHARNTTLTYATPAKPEGTEIAVRRFGGRNGLGLSGKLDGQTFDMTVTPGACSDGMSDRRFPFAVMFKIGEEVRQGCGWTDRKRYSQPQ
jgi:uncharacterized membrane protein